MNEPFRLLYVTGSELDRRTGAAVNEREFIRGLLDCGLCESRVVAAAREATDLGDEDPERRVTLIRSHGGRWRGVPGFAWRFGRAARRVIQDFRPHLALHRLTAIPLVETWLHWDEPCPRAAKTLVSGEALLRDRLGLLGGWAASLARHLTGRWLREAVLVDTVSPAWARWAREEFSLSADQVAALPNGAAVDRFAAPSSTHWAKPAARPRLVFAGSLRNWFALDTLIEAVALVPERDRQFELVLAGTGPDEAKLRALAAARGVERTVQFLGWVEYARLPQLLWSCHWGLDLTDISAPLRAGPCPTFFSQKPAQYLAAGLPVIAWDVDGAEFLRTGLGLCTRRRDPAALAATLFEAAALARETDFQTWRERAAAFALAERSQVELARRRVEAYRARLAVRSGRTQIDVNAPSAVECAAEPAVSRRAG